MSGHPFYRLCEELRPFIQRQATNMRLPVDVETQVAVSLTDEGKLRKSANALWTILVRRVTNAVAIQLGPK